MATLPATAGGVPVEDIDITMNPVHICTVTIASIACVTDLRTRRIPNVLTFGAAVAGLAYQFATGGVEALGQAALGWLLGALVFIVPFALGGLGGGDVKLLAALGAWLGPADALWLALYTGVAGGVMALGVSRLLRLSWAPRCGTSSCSCVTGSCRYSGGAGDHARGQPGPKLAYAFPILAGLVTTVWLR